MARMCLLRGRRYGLTCSVINTDITSGSLRRRKGASHPTDFNSFNFVFGPSPRNSFHSHLSVLVPFVVVSGRGGTAQWVTRVQKYAKQWSERDPASGRHQRGHKQLRPSGSNTFLNILDPAELFPVCMSAQASLPHRIHACNLCLSVTCVCVCV